MKSNKMKIERAVWVPFWFCVALSLITFVEYMAKLVFVRSHMGISPSLSFLAFLPMCFYFMGNIVRQLQTEIVDLRTQIAQLQANADNLT